MIARRLHFKARPQVTPGRTRDRIWFPDAKERYELGDAITLAAAEYEAMPRGTFDTSNLGEVDRLAWPDHATSVSRFAVVSHSSRYAAWLDRRDDTLCIVDAQRDQVLHLSWSSLNRLATITVGAKHLYVADSDLTIIPLTEIEHLFEHPVSATIDFAYESRQGHPTQVDRTRSQSEQLIVMLERAEDPVPGGFQQPEAPQRTAELDALLSHLADAPDDHTREILVDLWQDAGEPYAPLFARMLAGNIEVRDEALGLVSTFLSNIEYAGGLPIKGRLGPAPHDPAMADAVCADQRLGLFTELLLLRTGDPKLYTRLCCAERAVGLRAVFVPDTRFLQALVAAGRTQLTALYGVKFATKETIKTLVDPAFDRVTYLSMDVDFKFIANQLDWIVRDEAGFWARTPRTLKLIEKNGADDALSPAIRAAWPKLPLAGIVTSKLTLSR